MKGAVRDLKTGKFVAGHTGGPGRPLGSGAGSRIEEYRKILNSKVPELIEKAIALALEGDTVALRMCLGRAWPIHSIAVEELREQIEDLRHQLDSYQGRKAA